MRKSKQEIKGFQFFCTFIGHFASDIMAVKRLMGGLPAVDEPGE